MKLGVCTPIDNIDIAARLGYDYIEPALCQVAEWDEETFAGTKAKVHTASIACEAFNMLFPGGMRLVGPGRDMDAVRAYAERAFARAAVLGGKMVVFGSAAARSRPDGMPKDDAHQEMLALCRLLGEVARPLDLTVVIEPLNSKDCNLVTSVGEGLALVREAAHPAVALLADSYHMERDGESLAVLNGCGDWLRHCHVSCGAQRAYPTRENLPDCMDFIETLRSAGYNGRLSIEGITEDFSADAAASAACLRGGESLL